MRILFFTLSLFAMTFVASAQESELKAHSVYDVNQDGKVSVSDVPFLAKRLTSNATSNTSSDTQKLLGVIEALKQQLAAVLAELSDLKAKTSGAGIVFSRDYVDMGLSVKWASRNIGAENPEDAGLYFAWGETTGYTSNSGDGHVFDWASYKWMDHAFDDSKGCLKYTFADGKTSAGWYKDGSYIGTLIDGSWVKDLTTLDATDDAAAVNWGGSWRMPTDQEWEELIDNCTWSWDADKKGYMVTSKKNGNSIFLPAAGSRSTRVTGAGTKGNYWSSDLSAINSSYANYLTFDSNRKYMYDYNRYEGRSIRPVCP